MGADGEVNEIFPSHLGSSPEPERAFDEAAYLLENPDVASAIARGEVASGYEHYVKYGLREGRLVPVSPNEPSNRLVRTTLGVVGEGASRIIRQFFEALILSRGGGVLVIGWIDDAADPISFLRVTGQGWRLTFGGETLGRSRRYDVEEALGTGVKHPYAYYGFVYSGEPITTAGALDVEIGLKSGALIKLSAQARLVEDIELRDILLSAHLQELIISATLISKP